MAGKPENSENVRDRASVVQKLEFQQATILSELIDGSQAKDLPEGVAAPAPRRQWDTGGARLVDALAAKSLGVKGNNDEG